MFFTLLVGNIFAQPGNNECLNSIVLNVNNTCIYTAGTTTNATLSAYPTSCLGNADDDVWYTFLYSGGQITIEVIGSDNFDPVVELSYNCTTPSIIACSNTSGTGGTEIITPSTLSTGNFYQIRVYHYGAWSGSGTFEIAVTTASVPIAIAGSNSPVCEGTSLNFTSGGGNSYTWTGPNSFTSSSQNPTINNVTPAATGTYTVTALANGVCKSTDTTSVTVSASPNVPNNPTSNSPQCTDVGVTLTRSGSVPTGETWYWQGTNCGTSTTNSGTTYLATVSGTYYIRSRNNASQCWSPTCGSIAVIVNPNPTAPTSGGNIMACTNTIPATLSATPPSGSTVDWYNVSSGGSPLISGSNTYSTSTAGNYYAESRNTTTGCKSTNRTLVTLTVNPLPTIITIATDTVCIGSSITITATGGISYSWTPSGQTTANATVSPTTNTTYTVTGTNANGCSNTSTTAVTVNPLPTIIAIGTNTICLGTSTSLTASGGVSYNWSPGGQITASVIVSPTATTTYTVTGTNTNGCSNTASVSITVNQAPSLTLSSNSPLCPGSNLNLSANFVAGASYSWTGPNSFSSTSQNPPIANATVADSGMYHCTITGSNGCSRTDSMLVIVSTTPYAFITPSGSTAICSGDSVVLTATQGSSYLWNTTATTQSITVTSAGNYSCTVNSPNGCSGNAISPAVNITINPVPTIPVITQNGFTLASSISGTSYQWYRNGILQPADTTQFITITSTENGSWWVVVINSFDCSAISPWFNSTVGINELSNNSAVRIYPNPTNSTFSLSYQTTDTEDLQIQVLNTIGEVVFSGEYKKVNGKFSKEINLTNVVPGIYSVQIKAGEKVYQQKLVKE